MRRAWIKMVRMEIKESYLMLYRLMNYLVRFNKAKTSTNNSFRTSCKVLRWGRAMPLTKSNFKKRMMPSTLLIKIKKTNRLPNNKFHLLKLLNLYLPRKPLQKYNLLKTLLSNKIRAIICLRPSLSFQLRCHSRTNLCC